MRNESGLKPLGHAVLVRPYEPERKDSVIFIPEKISDRESLVEQRALVIECGPACWPKEDARAKPGDAVLVTKLSGYTAIGTADGKKYRFVNDDDLFAKITSDSGVQS